MVERPASWLNLVTPELGVVIRHPPPFPVPAAPSFLFLTPRPSLLSHSADRVAWADSTILFNSSRQTFPSAAVCNPSPSSRSLRRLSPVCSSDLTILHATFFFESPPRSHTTRLSLPALSPCCSCLDSHRHIRRTFSGISHILDL